MRGPDFLRRGLGLSLLLAAAPLPARVLHLTAPAAGDRLVPGSIVATTWASNAIAEGVDEGELVLSLDGGRTFSVRVSAEIEPGQTRVDWRVPRVPTAHARLALRFGREGDAKAERIELVSAEFAIATDPANLEERFFRVGGEWRTREALAPRARGMLLTALLPPTALASHRETEDFVDAPRPSPLVTPVLHATETPSRTADRLPAAPDALPAIGRPTSPLRL